MYFLMPSFGSSIYGILLITKAFNLYCDTCSEDVKAAPYLAIARPLMEYASVVWDPHQSQCVY